MKIKIQYREDRITGTIPFCAFTLINGGYLQGWSPTSFEDAKAKLIEAIKQQQAKSGFVPPSVKNVQSSPLPKITTELQAICRMEQMAATRKEFQEWWTFLKSYLKTASETELRCYEMIAWAAWKRARGL